MSKTIAIGLSASEFEQAARMVDEYRRELNTKCQRFVSRCAEEGLRTINAVIANSQFGNIGPISTGVEYSNDSNTYNATIYASGEAILFLEFGSGIHYNNGRTHPKAAELGYGVGTYPGQTHAFNNRGWYYLTEDEQWKHSYGVRAEMPMYDASVYLKNRLNQIAKEVFMS